MPLRLCSLLFFMLFQLWHSFAIFPPSYHGYFVHDLYGSDTTDFKAFASQWNVSNENKIITQPVGECVHSFLGGPGILKSFGHFERTYSSLPSHTIIYYTFLFHMIGSWLPSDYFSVTFDDQAPIVFTLASNYGKINTCMGNDYGTFVVGKALHSNNTVNIQFRYQFSNSLPFPSFGVRDIVMNFASKKTNDEVETLVVKRGTYRPNGYGCGIYFYEDSPGHCSQCSINCKFCFGPSDNECYYQKTGKYCGNDNCVECTPNCTYCFEPQKCSVCDTNYTLSWDYSCKLNSLCAFPYILEGAGRKECKTPCQPDKYMLWNGTCIPSCPAPLKSIIEGQAMFCNYSCNQQAGEYLYWNGSCSLTCNYSKRDEGGYKFCDACEPGYFLYPDGKCLAVCPSIFERSTQGGSQFCQYPCKLTSSYYYLNAKVCKSTCEYPYKIESSVLCVENLSEDDIKQLQSLSSATTGINTAMSVTSSLGSFIDFKSTDGAATANLVKMLWYIRYMNIKYPLKLQKILDLHKVDGGLAKFIPDIPEEWRASAPSFPLPGKFDQYKHHSNFLINFWQSLMILLILSAVIAMICIICFFSRKTKTIHSICQKVKTAIKWNIFFSIYLSCYDSMILYSALQLKTIYFRNLISSIGFMVCLVMNTLALIVFIVATKTIISYRLSKQRDFLKSQKRQSQKVSSKWQSFEILFTQYKEHSLLQQTYVPIFLARITFFNLIISYLYEYPLTQAISITVMSSLMLFYLAVKLPLKEIVRQIQYLVQETILLIVNICVLILAVLDNSKMESYQARETIGNVIIGCNIAFSILSSLFMTLLVLIKIWTAYKNWRNSRSTTAGQNNDSILSENVNLNTSLPIKITSPQRIKNTHRLSTFDHVSKALSGKLDDHFLHAENRTTANSENYRIARNNSLEHFDNRRQINIPKSPGFSAQENEVTRHAEPTQNTYNNFITKMNERRIRSRIPKTNIKN